MGFSVDPGQAPAPPKVFPVDIPATENAAVTADIFGYDLSDKDFAARFPGLVSARQADVTQAYNEMTGPLNPTTESEFVKGGVGQAMTAFGQGGEGPVTGQGTIGRNTVATSVAGQTRNYQDNARNYFESLLQANPERGIGLSGADAANLAIANTGNLSAANQQAYAAKIAQQNANTAASNQERAATTGAIISTLGSVISAA